MRHVSGEVGIMMRILACLVVAAALGGMAATGCARAKPSTPATQAPGSSGPAVVTAPTPPLRFPTDTLVPTGASEPKMDAALIRLARTFAAKGLQATLAEASAARVALSGGLVSVDIACRGESDVESVVHAVKSAGGSVTTTFKNYVFAAVPVAGVAAVAALDAVWTMAVSQAHYGPKRD